MPALASMGGYLHVSGNCALTTLDLAGNLIGQRGLEPLLTALERNCSLTTLECGSNIFEGVWAMRLATALERNQAGVLVLTISIELRGPAQYEIVCTTMGGLCVARLDIQPRQTIAILRKAIVGQLAFRGHLRLALANGKLLVNPNIAIADCFPSLPSIPADFHAGRPGACCKRRRAS